MIVKPADGIVGQLLNTRNDGTLVFRVYGEVDASTGRKLYVDYELMVDNLGIQIVQPWAELVIGDDGKNYIVDFSAKKKIPGRTVP